MVKLARAAKRVRNLTTDADQPLVMKMTMTWRRRDPKKTRKAMKIDPDATMTVKRVRRDPDARRAKTKKKSMRKDDLLRNVRSRV